MKTRFNPFPRVDYSRGAPMGRVSTRDFAGADLTPDQLCARRVYGECDRGGAYWGWNYTGEAVHAVWERGNGHAGVQYIRAVSKAAAFRNALDGTPPYRGETWEDPTPLEIEWVRMFVDNVTGGRLVLP